MTYYCPVCGYDNTEYYGACIVCLHKFSQDDLINMVQQIQSDINKNQMTILNLAFNHAPKDTKNIMIDIRECKSEIKRLSK